MGLLTKAATAVEGFVDTVVTRSEKVIDAVIGKELPAPIAAAVEGTVNEVLELGVKVAETEVNAEVAKLDPATPAVAQPAAPPVTAAPVASSPVAK